MKNSNAINLTLAAITLTAFLATSARANLIGNGTFTASETFTDNGGQVGSIPDWTFDNDSGSIGVDGKDGYTVFGPYYAGFYQDNLGNPYTDYVFLQSGNSNGGYTDISQNFAVVAGDTYTLTFDVAGRYNFNTGSFAEVLFGDSQGDNSAGFSANVDTGTTYSYNFTQETLSFTATKSGTGTVTLENAGDAVNGPNDNTADFTNIDVEQTGSGSVPEPSTWALLVAGVAALGLVLRRRLRA